MGNTTPVANELFSVFANEATNNHEQVVFKAPESESDFLTTSSPSDAVVSTGKVNIDMNASSDAAGSTRVDADTPVDRANISLTLSDSVIPDTFDNLSDLSEEFVRPSSQTREQSIQCDIPSDTQIQPVSDALLHDQSPADSDNRPLDISDIVFAAHDASFEPNDKVGASETSNASPNFDGCHSPNVTRRSDDTDSPDSSFLTAESLSTFSSAATLDSVQLADTKLAFFDSQDSLCAGPNLASQLSEQFELNNNIDGKNLITMHPELASLPEFTSYVEATNLALQYPELASIILSHPLAIMKDREPKKAPKVNDDLKAHSAERPNWALAPPDDGPKRHTNSRPNWALAPDDAPPSRSHRRNGTRPSTVDLSTHVLPPRDDDALKNRPNWALAPHSDPSDPPPAASWMKPAFRKRTFENRYEPESRENARPCRDGNSDFGPGAPSIREDLYQDPPSRVESNCFEEPSQSSVISDWNPYEGGADPPHASEWGIPLDTSSSTPHEKVHAPRDQFDESSSQPVVRERDARERDLPPHNIHWKQQQQQQQPKALEPPVTRRSGWERLSAPDPRFAYRHADPHAPPPVQVPEQPRRKEEPLSTEWEAPDSGYSVSDNAWIAPGAQPSADAWSAPKQDEWSAPKSDDQQNDSWNASGTRSSSDNRSTPKAQGHHDSWNQPKNRSFPSSRSSENNSGRRNESYAESSWNLNSPAYDSPSQYKVHSPSIRQAPSFESRDSTYQSPPMAYNGRGIHSLAPGAPETSFERRRNTRPPESQQTSTWMSSPSDSFSPEPVANNPWEVTPSNDWSPQQRSEKPAFCDNIQPRPYQPSELVYQTPPVRTEDNRVAQSSQNAEANEFTIWTTASQDHRVDEWSCPYGEKPAKSSTPSSVRPVESSGWTESRPTSSSAFDSRSSTPGATASVPIDSPLWSTAGNVDEWITPYNDKPSRSSTAINHSADNHQVLYQSNARKSPSFSVHEADPWGLPVQSRVQERPPPAHLPTRPVIDRADSWNVSAPYQNESSQHRGRDENYSEPFKTWMNGPEGEPGPDVHRDQRLLQLSAMKKATQKYLAAPTSLPPTRFAPSPIEREMQPILHVIREEESAIVEQQSYGRAIWRQASPLSDTVCGNGVAEPPLNLSALLEQARDLSFDASTFAQTDVAAVAASRATELYGKENGLHYAPNTKSSNIFSDSPLDV
ncbi:hypothetical protein C8J56DRAFT_569672 [Mycena floridula]|nr:hypothetical protein C8J56DRAFT_569672 [Mycena floridula]